MTPFPREDYRPLRPYDPGRTPVAVDLSDNTNLWGPHPAALEVVRQAPQEALTRYPSEIKLIRKEIAPDVNATTMEMGMKVLNEKGKLDKFMNLMK